MRIRLRSDVPVGVFLSGGIDSGLVTASAARASIEPLRTFSVGMPDERFDERPLARLIAEQYGTRHTEVMLDLATEVSRPEELLTHLVSMYDQPYADSSAIPSSVVAPGGAQAPEGRPKRRRRRQRRSPATVATARGAPGRLDDDDAGAGGTTGREDGPSPASNDAEPVAFALRLAGRR